MKKFFFLFLFLLVSFFLRAENQTWVPGNGWNPPPNCPSHNFDIPRTTGRKAAMEALKLGFLRHIIMAPKPEDLLYRMWNYTETYSEFRSHFHFLLDSEWEKFSTNWDQAVSLFQEANESVIVEFIKAHATSEVIATLIPELRECIKNWENLDEQTKGYYLGYVIGHYGLDCLIWKGALQSVRAYQRLKKANFALTLETACLSPHQAEEILASAEKFWQKREEYKAKCFLHIDKQNKHVPGSHNFEPGGSEITISLKKLELLAKKNLGKGIPEKGLHLGELNYKEIVNFGEEIGVVISKDTSVLGSTTWGKIHYDNNGGYHVIPSLPPGK